MPNPSTNSERAVQNRIIKLLHKYNGYEYIGNLRDTENTNIREDILRTFLMERQELTSAQATEAIRRLNRPDAGRIPIIALTANAFNEDVMHSLQSGLNAHLSKPVEPELLYKTLSGFLAR